tara:strand:- start:322 stop:945 length:624 start_codon:yes stop_codon:yes gene_type:complete
VDFRKHLGDLELEISSRCTIGCCACPRNYQPKDTWHSGFMDIDVLKDIVENSDFRKYVFCGGYGDAIYHPKVLEICEYMLSTDKFWLLETNGAHKPKRFWDQLVDLPWRRRCGFIFSIDGLQDTNHIYRKNSDWDSIMYGVSKILSKPRKQRMRMKWKYLVFPYNEHQVEDARKYAMDLGFEEFEPVKSIRKYHYLNEEEKQLIEWQ